MHQICVNVKYRGIAHKFGLPERYILIFIKDMFSIILQSSFYLFAASILLPVIACLRGTHQGHYAEPALQPSLMDLSEIMPGHYQEPI